MRLKSRKCETCQDHAGNKRAHNKRNLVARRLWFIPLAAVIILSGCSPLAVTKREGLTMMRSAQYDEAVVYFDKALKENPQSSSLRTLLFKAKLNSYYTHLALARHLKELDKKDEAIREYTIALEHFPGNQRIKDELETYQGTRKKDKKPFVSNIKPPVELKVDPKEKVTLNLKSTPLTKIFQTLGKTFNINFIFDKDFRDFVYSMEIADVGFFDVLNQLCLVGSAEYRILGPTSILIYPNTTFKKRTFGLKGVKVFYLSNTKAEDAKKLVMTVFREQQILVQEDTNLNTLIIKASDNTLREIEKFIHSVDKEKSEVEIDVEILELNRNFAKSLGLNFGDAESALSNVSVGSASGENGAISSTMKISNVGKSSFFITLPSAAVHFLESDSDTRIVSRPNLRGVENEEIKFIVGDDIPIPQTQFQAGAAGGINNIPVTSYQYKNVGVEIKITPTIHRNREVTLKIRLKMDFILSYRGDFPVLGKRELESVIRLKEGESSIIGGFIKDEERGQLAGFPVLSKIPLLGRIFGSGSKGKIQTDLLFSITPRVVRHVEITDDDRKAIWINAQTNPAGAGGEAPGPAGGPRAPGEARPKRGQNAILVSPRKRRVPVNAVSYFTLRLNSSKQISSLSLGGSVSGAQAQIEEVKTDFFGGKNAKVLSNFSGGSFDLGYTFDTKPIRSSVVAQLKIKFTEKGKYTLSVNSASAYSKDRQQVDLTTSSAEIEVY